MSSTLSCDKESIAPANVVAIATNPKSAGTNSRANTSVLRKPSARDTIRQAISQPAPVMARRVSEDSEGKIIPRLGCSPVDVIEYHIPRATLDEAGHKRLTRAFQSAGDAASPRADQLADLRSRQQSPSN